MEIMTQPSTIRQSDPYLEQFERLIEPSAGKHPAWVFPLRKAGMARFAELGFPTLQHEDWRFTNVGPIAKLPFKPLIDAGVEGLSSKMLGQTTFSAIAGTRLVFLNGQFSKAFSNIGRVPNGVKIGNLAVALATDSTLLEKHLGRYAETVDNAFAALNTAFFLDGAFIYVAAHQAVAEPIRLVFVNTSHEEGATVQPRNLIIAEAGSRLTVIESYLSTNHAACFTNAVTELVVADNAVVEHLKFQDESPNGFHIATLHGHFGRASNANVHSFALGARLSRYNIRTK